MPRERKGYVKVRTEMMANGKKKEFIYARVTYTDITGKRKEVVRRATDRTHAKEIIKDIIRELDERGFKGVEATRMTFAQLAAWFSERYLVPAKYVGGRKVAGRRTYEEARRVKDVLVAHFGPARIRELTHADIERYKEQRIDTPVVIKKKDGTIIETRQRTIRSVNIELSFLRRMLNVALREGWLIRNPFNSGDTLISAADENKRDRILSLEEEERLLTVCSDAKREHLKPLLICALDTGMRRGEIFKLQWKDVDLVGRSIHIQAFNTKTMRERDVPMTERLFTELSEIYSRNSPSPTDLVFGIKASIRKGFRTARRLANIRDFHLHDARHTFATRLIQGGMPIAEVARLLGHTSVTTTYRYLNMAPNTAARALDILNRLHHSERPYVEH